MRQDPDLSGWVTSCGAGNQRRREAPKEAMVAATASRSVVSDSLQPPGR